MKHCSRPVKSCQTGCKEQEADLFITGSIHAHYQRDIYYDKVFFEWQHWISNQNGPRRMLSC